VPEPGELVPATHQEIRGRLVSMIGEITRRDVPDPSAITDATLCVGSGLLTDSLDVLEFVVALQREFGVSIRDGDVGRTVLSDLGTLTRYVLEHRVR